MFVDRISARPGTAAGLPAPWDRSADPERPAAVAAALLDYLGQRLGVSALAYAAPPAPLGDGWEGYLYSFHLQAPALLPPWDRPLVLRIHGGREAVAKARREAEVPGFLVRLGYPVAPVILLEEDCRLFGGPFLVMEQVPGTVLLDVMLARPWGLLHFPARMAEAQARLHDLPTAGFPAPRGPFLPRHLAGLAAEMARHRLDGLAAGLAWLEAHQPGPPAEPRILHLDFHPLNLIVRPDDSFAVLDWTYADVGDPHADVASTLMLLDCVPLTGTPWQRLASLVGRPVVSAWYLRAYRRRRRLDEERLAYYRAWATLSRLVRFGRWQRGEPQGDGCKLPGNGHLDAGLIERCCGYFQRWTGVRARL